MIPEGHAEAAQRILSHLKSLRGDTRLMADEELAHGIRAIDCAIYPRWPGMEEGPHAYSKMGPLVIRDEDSRTYDHPAQHHFKDSAARIQQGDTPEGTIALMNEFGIEAAMVLVDPDYNPEASLKVIERYPDRLFGKLYIRPHQGMEAVRKIEEYAKGNPNIKALNISPFATQRPPNDKVFYPIYAKAIELNLPVAMTLGIPGPRVPGFVQDPIHLDEPLWFFPELKIVIMHGGEPWEAMCVKLMLKWPNLYYMTSAFTPRHYPEDIVHYANTRGSDKILYAGYYPGLPYDRLKTELNDLPLREHVWPKFLRENAARVFRLGIS